MYRNSYETTQLTNRPATADLRRGMSRIGVIVFACCVVILIVILLPITQRARRQGRFAYEQSQLAQIHMAWAGFLSSDWGYFPIPGLIDRRESDRYEDDVRPIGQWPESRNTTAHLFAALIARDYFTPNQLISPRERNPIVVVDDGYDYTKYSPGRGVFWDPTFVADLQTGSNVSYAHLPMVGNERIRRWRTKADRSVAHLGNRGPQDGISSAQLYSCQADGSWIGQIVFGDGHQELLKIDAGVKITLSSTSTDNPFHVDDDLETSDDQVLAFTQQIVDRQPVLQHD